MNDVTKIFAHTLPGHGKEDWQPLHEHLAKTAEIAEGFAESINSSDFAWNAGWLHDLGKIDDRFQKKLHQAMGLEYENEADPGSVNHSGAGAAFAESMKSPIGRTLAYLVIGHHAGLPDYESDKTGNAALIARMSEAQKDFEAIREKTDEYLKKLRMESSIPKFVKPENYHLWVRMLFSCLVDADWLDTERFMDFAKHAKRPTFPLLTELKKKFDAEMSKLSGKEGKLNEIRSEILAACRDAAKKEPGLFSLTVPTGGGKTLSSMAFALDHAIKYGKKRIIYVIPYTSIIEQTAKVLRRFFGDENVVEHHSNVVREDKDDRREMDYALELASENWDAPIIVTTNVQFFESLYAAKPSRCRKLHNIAESVVLLDEAQLLPPEYLTPCVDVINQLTRSFGVSMVLCTATQPVPPKLDEATEIIPDRQKYYDALKRVEYHFPESLDEKKSWEDIAKELKGHGEVLCVVNTRKDCRELYELLNDKEETVHLSALMCGEHRSDVIKEIKDRLEENRTLRKEGKPIKPIRVISTQLVEAGVDIDFPVVYRALAGLDSIVQAAGRCNREGKYEIGHCFVFVPPKPAPRGLLRKGEDTMREFLAADIVDVQDPSIYEKYFDVFYGSTNKDGKEFIELLRPNQKNGGVYFRTVGETFRLIDDGYTLPVIVMYEKGEELLKRLQHEGPHKELMRQLQRYTVNVPKTAVQTLFQTGMVRDMEFRGKPSGILVQNISSCYTTEFGFDIMSTGLSTNESII